MSSFICENSKLDEEKENNRASKPHSTPATLQWLEENYEIAEGVCIPRSALYMHYLDFCEKNDTQPVNAASFGKIIRQQFPQLTTRRLGTRGQSKYHYYGIAVKESSQYYDVMYSKKGAAWVSETGKKEVSKQTVAYSPRSKLGTLLPEFPNVKDLNLPASLPEEKVSTFIMMYRTHCQRILDTVIRANFDEGLPRHQQSRREVLVLWAFRKAVSQTTVQSFLLHFWQGMPPHMLPVLGSSTVVNIVGVCDSILYKAISGVLMPTVLQALPDSLTQVIRKFAKQLDEWLKVALHDLPENLRNIKFELIHSADITFQMLEDWRNVDLNSITKQTLYTMEDSRDEHRKLIIQLYQEFDHLLEEQSPIESYIEWLDTMVDRCVVKVGKLEQKVAAKKQGSLKKVAQQFLLMWSCFGTRVIRDMTLHSAPSFDTSELEGQVPATDTLKSCRGNKMSLWKREKCKTLSTNAEQGSFHLIHLMFDDYVLYLLESLHCQERASELMRAMKGEGSTAEVREEIILTEAAPPTPSPVPSFSPAKSAASMEVPPPSSPASNPSPEYTGLSTTGAMQSYTWSLTYTVTTAAGSPAENSQQLPCMRSTHVPSSSVTHRIPVYPHREEHGYTGSYNYGSYGNQHPPPMQSQYPALPHDTAISGPLHYSPYHRSSAQHDFRLRVLNKKRLYSGQSSLDPRVCAQCARGSHMKPDVKCERTLSEKDSASLKLAEVMNSSQDGSPTSQACGILGIHPAVSLSRLWYSPGLERKGICGPSEIAAQSQTNQKCLNRHRSTFKFESTDEDKRKKLCEGIFKVLIKDIPTTCQVSCLEVLRILSRDKKVLVPVTTKENMQILLRLAKLNELDDSLDKVSEFPVIVESLKCLCNIVFNSQMAQQLSLELNLAAKLCNLLRKCKDRKFISDIKCFDLRLLFLLSLLHTDIRSQLRYELQGLPLLTQILESAFSIKWTDEYESAIDHNGPPLSPQETDCAIEALKALFNVTVDSWKVHKESDSHQFRVMAAVLRHCLLIVGPTEEKTEELH
ncbi:regulatory factor X, 4 (influences HLA class II expression) isoform 1, partial [Camelus ferus]